MEKIKYGSKYFNVKDTLECGQIFRFKPYKEGYVVYSLSKCAYCYNEGNFAYIECESEDKDYFCRFFDLDKDYGEIVGKAISSNYEILRRSAELGKGVRILNQDIEETVFSFIVSQNNNIPNIKKIIEKMCLGLGEKKSFMGEDYYAFPTIEKMAKAPLEFYKSISLGYRAEYIKKLAENISNGFSLVALNELSTEELKKSLVKLYGIGRKVADC
ncbi:MAG: hypothetical protein KBS91_04555, partial [Firmicutes bacterium]|nr:hypothetical protein [Candidatus Caballimonas caccae]